MTLPVRHTLRCAACATTLDDDGLILSCPACREDSLLIPDYPATDSKIRDDAEGLFRYRDYLPIRRELPGSQLPLVYRSEALAAEIGLPNLWISFSGHWPERGRRMASASFKDMEPYVVLARMAEASSTLVIPSAGNTAAAFAAACSQVGKRCLLVIPDYAISSLHGVDYDDKVVKVVAIQGGTYNDALSFAARLCNELPSVMPEGGVRNVARRAGLGVVMLAAHEQLGRLPDYYFQAVGSAAGALGSYEVSRRVVGDAGGPSAVPRMMLCQNKEYAPIFHRWKHGGPPDSGRGEEPSVFASVLTNNSPPYAAAGGIGDMLRDTDGEVLLADASAAATADAMTEELEGIDVEPAAAVAIACLRQAAMDEQIPRDAVVLLNITGGGRRARARAGAHAHAPTVDFPVDARAIDSPEAVDAIARWEMPA